MVQQQTTRETEIGKFITYRSQRKFSACLKGPRREVKAECRQRQDLGRVPFLGSVGGVLWSSWAKAGLTNSNPKRGVLVSPTGVLTKGCMMGISTGRQGGRAHKGAWGSHQELAFACDSRACASGRGECRAQAPTGHPARWKGCQGSSFLE